MRCVILGIAYLLAMSMACDKSSGPASNANTGKPADAHHDHDGHDHGDGDDHDDGHDHAHGGEVIELGTETIGGVTLRASRDKGEIKPGGDAPIDVWLTASDGKPTTAAAVRFWIGTEDAKGSIKARADIEIPAEPNHWHTHAEVPDPLPPEAKLWVEVETESGDKRTASFSLKM